jgi:hypothetical protein
MTNLNIDILYLIFEELRDDRKTLCSCLLVNKTWCTTIIPILWKNPWIIIKKKDRMLLLGVIILHLSNVSKSKIGEYKFLINFYKKPSFNYISYCRYLNLEEIQSIINNNIYDESKRLIVQNEIFNIFINENMNFTHLYICQNFGHQIHLNHGAERCFSGVEFLSCSTEINDNILNKLIETCKSIKELKLFIKKENNNYGIIKLIEVQKKLININLTRHTYDNESFCKVLENSLIKHANTIQYCKVTRQPSTKFLSSLENLKELELGCNIQAITSWNYLENISLPFLKVLRSSSVPIEVLTSLIKNTSGSLIIVKIDYISHNEISNKNLIQVIYQNCPNIKYLKLLVRNCNISELEKLLISCQYLNGLYILVSSIQDRVFCWNNLFNVLTKSSPSNLFKFKLHCNVPPKSEFLKLFFDNWEGRHPMFLQLISDIMFSDLMTIESYKEKGIIEKFDYGNWWNQKTEDFEWI